MNTDKSKVFSNKLTPFGQHLSNWHKGCGSGECKKANNVCLARGDVPCDVLFVGQAPGESEDALGLPFVGPAGQLLDRIVADAFNDGRLPDEKIPRICFTNVVGCIPRDEQGREDEPMPEQIRACAPRLQEMLMVADGKDLRGREDREYMNREGTLKLIVLVGKTAQDSFDHKLYGGFKPHRQIVTVAIPHPAYLLRLNVATRGLEIQKCTVRLYNHWLDAWDRAQVAKRYDKGDDS